MRTTAYSRKDLISAKASIQGRRNKAEGASFEADVIRSCESYEKYRLAFIEKTPEPMKVIGKLSNSVFKAIYEKQAQPDFKGTLCGGRAICFDAKCTCTDKIQITALTDEELRCLTIHRELGAWAGVLMCFIQGKTKTYAMIPLSIFMSAKALNGHKHWTVDDVAKWKVKGIPTINGHYIDFLAGIID